MNIHTLLFFNIINEIVRFKIINTYAKRRSLFFIRFSISGIDSDFDSGALLIKTSLWRLVFGAFLTDFLASYKITFKLNNYYTIYINDYNFKQEKILLPIADFEFPEVISLSEPLI